MDYPKIETLYERDPITHRVTTELRWPEFDIPKTWLVTEKIDGCNVQVRLRPDGIVTVGGRSGERSHLPGTLIAYLLATFPQEKVIAAFDPGTEAYLFGEGYGPGIQRGGRYRPTVSFRLFDVAVIGEKEHVWWLPWVGVEDVARKLGVETVPIFAFGADLEAAVEFVNVRIASFVALNENGGAAVEAEGIVARTEPPLFRRNGQQLVWKLKVRDLP